MKRFGVLASAVLAVMALMAPAPAHAQATGTIDINVNLPDILILYYFSAVTIDIPATTLVTNPALTAGVASVDEGNAGTFNTFTPNLNISGTPFTAGGTLNALDITLNNAWAVRAITSGGNITVDFAANSANLSDGVNNIPINNITVDDDNGTANTSNAPGTTAATITIGAPGLLTPEVGSLGLQIDVSGVSTSGTYDEDFVITVTAA